MNLFKLIIIIIIIKNDSLITDIGVVGWYFEWRDVSSLVPRGVVVRSGYETRTCQLYSMITYRVSQARPPISY